MAKMKSLLKRYRAAVVAFVAAVAAVGMLSFGSVSAQAVDMFTVTFDSDGGSTVSSQSVEDGDAAEEPDDPTRDGYTFYAWLTDDDAVWDFSDPITSDMTLTALWLENGKVTIIYDANDGTNRVSTQAFDDDGTATLVNGSDLFDHDDSTSFVEWNKTSDGESTVYNAADIVEDFEQTDDSVTIQTYRCAKCDKGFSTSDEWEAHSEDMDSEGDSSHENYSVLNDNFYTDDVGVGSAIKLYAQWGDEDDSATSYTVTFDSDGGTSVASQTVIEGETAIEPDEPTRDGYEFDGWTLNDELYDFSTPVTSDITLTASWTEAEDDEDDVDEDVATDESEATDSYSDTDQSSRGTSSFDGGAAQPSQSGSGPEGDGGPSEFSYDTTGGESSDDSQSSSSNSGNSGTVSGGNNGSGTADTGSTDNGASASGSTDTGSAESEGSQSAGSESSEGTAEGTGSDESSDSSASTGAAESLSALNAAE